MPHRRPEGAELQEVSQFLCYDNLAAQRRSVQVYSRLRIRTPDRTPERALAKLRLLERGQPARSTLNRRFAFPNSRHIWQLLDRPERTVAAAVGPQAQTGQGTAFPVRKPRLMLQPGAVRNPPRDCREYRTTCNGSF